MKSLRIAVMLLITATLLGLTITPAFAERECVKLYGGGEVCEEKDSDLRVRKQIRNPKTGDFEDEIKPEKGSSPYIFETGDSIRFRIIVENTGDTRIENINLKDILPSFVKYRDGDGDGKDDDTEVEFDEFDLDSGEEETFEFTARVQNNGVSSKKDYICLTNIATAEGKVEDSDDKEKDTDYANFCIAPKGKVKGKEAPTRLPETGGLEGQELAGLLYTSFSTGLVLVGYGLRKYSA